MCNPRTIKVPVDAFGAISFIRDRDTTIENLRGMESLYQRGVKFLEDAARSERRAIDDYIRCLQESERDLSASYTVLKAIRDEIDRRAVADADGN